MAFLHRDHPQKTRLVSSSSDPIKSQPVSKLIIIQARFQQKQLQEKEEKLLRLYEEQQERAMNRVGSRVQSGGSSVSSTSSVGRGKVRHMFQSRRGNSESRQGRDRSYPLEPISAKVNLPVRTRSLDVDRSHRRRIPGSWSNASLQSNVFDSDLDYCEQEYYVDRPRVVRRTQSQARSEKPKLYFGGSHTDLRFSDELDYVQTFHVIDDHYEIPDRDLIKKKDRFPREDESNFNTKRQFYENRLRSDPELFQRLPNVGMNRSRKEVETRSKTFVSQKPFSEKPHLGSKKIEGCKETISPRQANGKTTNQPRKTQVPVRQPLKKEETPPVSTSKTAVRSVMSSNEKPPIAKKSTKTTPTTKTKPQSNMPDCQYCGRHFAEDRIAKHEEICKKSFKSKRKPFDSVKQRIKGTEAEQFLKGSKVRSQPQKQMTQPQRDWRKTHEDFINTIRAAREYQVSTNQTRKPSNMRSSATSRY